MCSSVSVWVAIKKDREYRKKINSTVVIKMNAMAIFSLMHTVAIGCIFRTVRLLCNLSCAQTVHRESRDAHNNE